MILPRVVKVENELAAKLSTEASMDCRGVKTAQTNLNLTQSKAICLPVCLQGTVRAKNEQTLLALNFVQCILEALLAETWIKAKVDHHGRKLALFHQGMHRTTQTDELIFYLFQL